MKRLSLVLCAGVIALAAGTTGAVESDPLPVPQGGVRERAVRAYNDGVALLVARKYADAQGRFEAALAIDNGLAEAHNNLAYALRMQGRQNFAASLAHYNRALELKPTLAQAYMYRGVLFVQRGDMDSARQDLTRLRDLDSKLAADLERVITGHGAEGGRAGVAPQYE